MLFRSLDLRGEERRDGWTRPHVLDPRARGGALTDRGVWDPHMRVGGARVGRRRAGAGGGWVLTRVSPT